MSADAATTDLPPVSTLIERLVVPATRMEDAWRIAAELKQTALALIRDGRRTDAVELARALGRSHALDAWVSDMCADVLQWATWQQWDPFVAQQAVTFAERGRFAFAFRVDHALRGRHRAPFFMSAMMPKSGGTYLSAALQRTYDYVTDIACVFGTDGEVLLSPARVSVFLASGGFYNHTHLPPSTWNVAILRDLQVPVWVHIRDPRDAFPSFLNMSHLEASRPGELADVFQARIEQETVAASRATADELATQLFPMFEYLCGWVRGWLSVTLPRMFLSRHDALLVDEGALFASAARALSLPDVAVTAPPRDYQEARFFKGTNGRWRTALGAPMAERMTEHMRATGLLDAFPE